MASTGSASLQTTPLVSYHGLKKVNKLIYPFAYTIAPIYDCTPREFLTRFGSIIGTIGALVYQADEEMEAAQRGETQFAGITPWIERKRAILGLLRELQIDDPPAEVLLDNIGTYWELENELNFKGNVTPELLAQAISLRSSDLLAYHHLCLYLSGVPNREEIFAVLIPWQIYVEFAFDLLEYPEDVAARDYNTYRMFVKLYGQAAPHYLQAEIVRYQRLMGGAADAAPSG